MSGYIGNIPTPQATQTRDTFTATAGQTSFATSGYTPGFLDVFLNGVHLVNGTDYTATNGSDVVLISGAALDDTLQVVAYTTFQTGDFVPTSGGTFSGAVDFDNTSHIKLPVGTTAQRPASPASGMIRQNSTTGEPEWYDAPSSVWRPLDQSSEYVVDYLIVAGGGGGAGGSNNGNDGGGGGGAGGMLFSSFVVAESTAYSFVVGAGGSGGVGENNGTQGGNSSAFSLTAVGGGFGSRANAQPGDGGSGGGGGGGGGSSFPGGTPTADQGNFGGTKTGSFPYNGAGGGGRGSRGSDARNVFGGNSDGGDGCAWVDGKYYAGGGGGGSGVTSSGSASNSGSGESGTGGGGHGGQDTTYGGITARNAQNGSVNRGGGGGGGKSQTAAGGTKNGGNGGSGVAIVRYAGAQRGTGGTVTSSGGFTYHTFTSSGTFTA